MLWASKTALNKRVYHSLAKRAICVEITNLMVIQILSPKVLHLMSGHRTPVKYVNRVKHSVLDFIAAIIQHLHDLIIIRNPQIICWGWPGSCTSPCCNILVTITITNYPAHNIYCYSGTTTAHHPPPPSSYTLINKYIIIIWPVGSSLSLGLMLLKDTTTDIGDPGYYILPLKIGSTPWNKLYGKC